MTVATETLRSQYERDGYLAPVDVFSAGEIADYRRRFDEVEAREGRETCQIGLHAKHFEIEFVWNLAASRGVVDRMCDVIGDDVMLLSSHFFCKYPDESGQAFVAWHQDVTYWGLEPPEAHTAWIAVDDSDAANGCMQVIPGSHTEGIVPHGTSDHGHNLLSIDQEIPDEYVDKTHAVNLELKAGQISIHHGRVYHSSNPNTSQRRRCGLTVRFIHPSARQNQLNSKGQGWRPILVRGEDRYGHYRETPPPFSLP